MAQTGGHIGPAGTQAQTDGEPSNLLSVGQRTFCAQLQMPPQSAPPALGSQPSLGSSTQRPAPGQGMPAIPPQRTGTGPHFPVAGSQADPAWHNTAAHASLAQSWTRSCLKKLAELPGCAANFTRTCGLVNDCVTAQRDPGDTSSVIAISVLPERSTARTFASKPPVGFEPAA